VAARLDLRRQRDQLGLDVLLEMKTVAPDLRRAAGKRVLVMQPPLELLLAGGKGERIFGRADVGVERGPESLERLKGRARRLGQPGGEARHRLAERGRDLHHQLAAAAERSERRVHEDRGRLTQGGARRVEELGRALQPLERGGRARGQIPARPGQQ
jgi:hypothetical protein